MGSIVSIYMHSLSGENKQQEPIAGFFSQNNFILIICLQLYHIS